MLSAASKLLRDLLGQLKEGLAGVLDVKAESLGELVRCQEQRVGGLTMIMCGFSERP